MFVKCGAEGHPFPHVWGQDLRNELQPPLSQLRSTYLFNSANTLSALNFLAGFPLRMIFTFTIISFC